MNSDHLKLFMNSSDHVHERKHMLQISRMVRTMNLVSIIFVTILNTIPMSFARDFAKEEDYTVDEKHKAIQLTDSGINKAEKALGVDNIYTEGGIKFVHH